MKVVSAVLFASIAFSSAVRAAPAVLVFRDSAEGYGDAVVDAIGQVWPDCVPEVYTGAGGQSGFNGALHAGPWDIVTIECWSSPLDGIDWERVLELYTGGGTRFFVYAFNWIGPDGLQDLANSMGIEAWSPQYGMDLMEVIYPGHPLVEGISNWSQDYVSSIMVQRVELLTNPPALPVTGWEWSQGNYSHGICVAADGNSVVSGFCPTYAVEGVDIWCNILLFLNDGQSLDPGTWGSIKTGL